MLAHTLPILIALTQPAPPPQPTHTWLTAEDRQAIRVAVMERRGRELAERALLTTPR